MNIENLSYSIGNIVMLYQDLSNAKVSRDQILNIFPDLKPQHFDVNPVFLVRYPTKRLEIFIFLEENRLEVKIGRPDKSSWVDLVNGATAVYKAIEGSQLKAFGYNFFVEISGFQEKAEKFLVNQFTGSLSSIQTQVGGEITSLATTLKYIKNNESHQLDILPNPLDGHTLDVRFNTHYDATALLRKDELLKSYIEHNEDFESTLRNLFS